jgi:hypothetical protein
VFTDTAGGAGVPSIFSWDASNNIGPSTDYFNEWGNTSLKPYDDGTMSALGTPRGFGAPDTRTGFGDQSPMDSPVQAPASDKKITYPWEDVARPQLRNMIPFSEPPKYDIGNERKRISDATKIAKWAVPLSLLFGMKPTDTLNLTGSLFSGLQDAITHDEQQTFGRNVQENALKNDYLKATNNAIQYENANKIDAYNREVANKIRNAEFQQRVLDAEADRQLKAENTASLVQDRTERVALAKRIQDNKEKAEKIRTLLSTIGNNRITPEAEERLAKQVRELGIDIPPDVYMSMSPEQKERYELLNRSQEERAKHWAAMEQEKKREFDKKTEEDHARFLQADATKRYVAGLQAHARQTGLLGKNPGLSEAYRVYSKQAGELASIATDIRGLRKSKQQFEMQALGVLKDPYSIDQSDPTGLNDSGKRRRKEYEDKAAELQSMIDAKDTEFRTKKINMDELLNSGFSDAVFAQQRQQQQTGSQMMAVMDANGNIIGYAPAGGGAQAPALGAIPGTATGGTPGQTRPTPGTNDLFALPGYDTTYATTNDQLLNSIGSAMKRAGGPGAQTPVPKATGSKKGAKILGMRPAGG